MIRLIYLLKSKANLLMVLSALRENIFETLIERYDCCEARFELIAASQIEIAIIFNQNFFTLFADVNIHLASLLIL